MTLRVPNSPVGDARIDIASDSPTPREMAAVLTGAMGRPDNLVTPDRSALIPPRPAHSVWASLVCAARSSRQHVAAQLPLQR